MPVCDSTSTSTRLPATEERTNNMKIDERETRGGLSCSGNNNLWMILQLSDSAFPTGGFVHSGGLEAAAQCGLVRDRESIKEYIKSQLVQAIHLYIPMVSVAYHCNMDMDNFACIDQFCEATLANNIANRASKTQGIALLSTASNAFPWTKLASAKRYIMANNLHAHQATIFGLVYNELGIDLATTQQMFLFTTLRALISSSVRLNLLGPLDAQNIQHHLSNTTTHALDSFLEKSKNSSAAINSATTSVRSESVWNMDGKWEKLEEYLDVVQTSPLLDLVQGMHDRLYSRMFNS